MCLSPKFPDSKDKDIVLLRIDNSRQERFGSGRAYPHFIHSYLMASLMIIH